MTPPPRRGPATPSALMGEMALRHRALARAGRLLRIRDVAVGRELPPGWRLVRGFGPDEDGAAWCHPTLGLRVIESAAIEDDGQRWHHVSVSRESCVPSWDDMCLVHRLFIGEEVAAYQVHVPRSRWISIHPHCLHLWACLDAPQGVLPDFASGGSTI